MNYTDFTSFMVDIMRYMTELPSKLYDVVNYSVNITWLQKLFQFFGSSLNVPSSVSLIAILGGLSAVSIAVIIIYNIFKL